MNEAAANWIRYTEQCEKRRGMKIRGTKAERLVEKWERIVERFSKEMILPRISAAKIDASSDQIQKLLDGITVMVKENGPRMISEEINKLREQTARLEDLESGKWTPDVIEQYRAEMEKKLEDETRRKFEEWEEELKRKESEAKRLTEEADERLNREPKYQYAMDAVQSIWASVDDRNPYLVGAAIRMEGIIHAAALGLQIYHTDYRKESPKMSSKDQSGDRENGDKT